jgi:hypothetical protein
MPFDLDNPPDPGVFYSDDDTVNTLLGSTNAAVDADLNSDGNSTTARMTRDIAHQQAKTKVDAHLLAEGVTTPLPGTPYYPWVQQAANWISANVLARVRGQLTNSGKPVDDYAVFLTDADALLNKVVAVTEFATGDQPLPDGPGVGMSPLPSNRFGAFVDGQFGFGCGR